MFESEKENNYQVVTIYFKSKGPVTRIPNKEIPFVNVTKDFVTSRGFLQPS